LLSCELNLQRDWRQYATFWLSHNIQGSTLLVAQLVEALRYKPEGRGFDSRWCHRYSSLTYYFRPHYAPGVDSASNRNEYQAHRVSRIIALPIPVHGYRRQWGVKVTHRPLFTPMKDPVLVVQEAGWTPGQVRTGAKNLVPTGIRSRNRPASSQSLYRLRYPAHKEVTHR